MYVYFKFNNKKHLNLIYKRIFKFVYILNFIIHFFLNLIYKLIFTFIGQLK